MSLMIPAEENPIQVVHRALKYRSRQELADFLGVQPRTVSRWLAGESNPKWGLVRAIEMDLAKDERPTAPDFTFVDLFAGIGGMRKGFEFLNGRCVFTSEWDHHAVRTYRANFSDSDDIAGDITAIDPGSIPRHDVLLAGFPCQPFSLAGVSKKNSLGRAHGFLDKTQGTLFFNIIEILRDRRPKAFLLENVKNLRSHDGGRTFKVIVGALRELGYEVHDRVISSSSWVPQRRERVFLVGFRDDLQVGFSFNDIVQPRQKPTLGDILHTSDEESEHPYTVRVRGRTVVSDRYTLSDHLWQYLQNYAAKHREKGNGFGCSVFKSSDVARTLSARYHKDGSEILIAQRGRNPRRLTPRECARLMGFDRKGDAERMSIPVSDTQAYRQFGNSVVVPVVSSIAKAMIPRILDPKGYPPYQPELELVCA